MHILICGQTGSGKTSLATSLSKQFRRRKRTVAVYDPFRDQRWDADYATTDFTAFSKWARRHENCVLFVDESGAAVGRFNEENFWLATEARHYGHTTIFICQRITQLNPIVRDQCEKFYIFRVSTKDAEGLAYELGNESILHAARMPKLRFLEVNRFGSLKQYRIDPASGKVEDWNEPLMDSNRTRGDSGHFNGNGNGERRGTQ